MPDKALYLIQLPEFEIQETPAQIILIINLEIYNLKIFIKHFIT
jgi:hypothetical protein